MATALLPTSEQSMTGKIKGYILTGMVVLVPISLTVYIIYELFLAIDGILKDVVFVIMNQSFGVNFGNRPIPGFGFITLFLLILGTGMAARSYFGEKNCRAGRSGGYTDSNY